jgi:hypothetical protein
MCDNSIIKPIKIAFKNGRRGGKIRKSNGGGVGSKFIICMYGNIIMKPF